MSDILVLNSIFIGEIYLDSLKPNSLKIFWFFIVVENDQIFNFKLFSKFLKTKRLLDDATSGSASSLLLTDLDDQIDQSTCSRLIQEEVDNPSSSSKLKRRRSSSSSDSSDTSSLSLLLSSEGLSLSELYLPPPITPRMISSLDDNSEDESSSASGGSKRSKSDAAAAAVDVIRRPALRPCNSLTMTSSASQASSASSGLSLLGQQQQTTSAAVGAANSNYSCGQSSSLFGELQSVVFHSLITSLES